MRTLRLTIITTMLLLMGFSAGAQPLPDCVQESAFCNSGCIEFRFGTEEYFECICECALDLCLCAQEVEGANIDVDECIADLQDELCTEGFPVGLVQENPVLPDTLEAGVYTFLDAPTGMWFDPPSTASLEYQMSGDAKFVQINGFPTGFDNPFKVWVGSQLLGSFEPGDFVTFGGGLGVSSFVISDISPEVDTSSEVAFPLRILFDTSMADFTMRAHEAPEPGLAAGTAAALVSLAWISRRRRMRR